MNGRMSKNIRRIAKQFFKKEEQVKEYVDTEGGYPVTVPMLNTEGEMTHKVIHIPRLVERVIKPNTYFYVVNQCKKMFKKGVQHD